MLPRKNTFKRHARNRGQPWEYAELERAKKQFEQEMSDLVERRGPKAGVSAYRDYAVATRWLNSSGHGIVKLSAIGHTFGPKVCVNTIVTAEGELE